MKTLDRTADQLTHTPTAFRQAAERSLQRYNMIPSREASSLRLAILSRQGVKLNGSSLNSARYYAQRKNDPLTAPLKKRHAERGFQLLTKLGKDRAGEMVTFEIECFVGRDSVQALKESLPLAVQMVSDGSLSSADSPRTRDMEGIELRIPCSVTDYSRLFHVCRLLNLHGAKVNKTCGLHVHFDMRDLSPLKRYSDIKAEGSRLHSVIATVGRYLVPPSRLNNRYCALTPPSLRDRYRAVNAEATSKHGTLEVRLHSGTVEADKARLWAEWCLFFLRRPLSKNQKTSLAMVYTPTAALDWILRSDLPPNLKWWSAQRLEKFHPSAVSLPSSGSNAAEASE